MKTVKKISNITAVLFCLIFFGCKQLANTSKKATTSSKDTISQTYNYDNIVTDRRSDKFDWNLIDVKPVRKGDTVLFNKETGEKTNKIIINNKISSFQIESFGNIGYYKTGNNKFSSYRISLKKIDENSSFDFYTSVNHGNDTNPYNPNNMTSFTEVIKINDSVAKFDVFYPNLLEYDIHFKVKNNHKIEIFKIFIQDNWEEKIFTYELDTIININRKNRFIHLKELANLTTDKKNLKK